MAFPFTHSLLTRLCAINAYPVPTDRMIFFGIRGCLSTDTDDNDFRATHSVELMNYDHTHPRCTLGQWIPQEGVVALFPGSTVPHMRYVRSARARDGRGANCLMTGYYDDYRKGVHKAGSPTGHSAFRQTKARPIRRSTDDFDFQNDDRVEFSNPYDNFHCAWTQSINSDAFASAGCQVVVGVPRCPRRGNAGDAGPWKIFRANAYELVQDSFPYVLMEGRDAVRAHNASNSPFAMRLRFGSHGPVVTQLQDALKQMQFYEGDNDGVFGERTMRAVLAFQAAEFGPDNDDGVVGPMTAEALGFTMPMV